MAGRFEGERETFQANIVKLEGKLKAMRLEHDNTSLAQRKEVRTQETLQFSEDLILPSFCVSVHHNTMYI